MRYRTVPMILFGLVCVIVTSYVVLTFKFKAILKQTDESMVEMQAKLELQRVKHALDKHRKMLDDLIRDYAVWDSFYLALKHNNEKWVSKTIKDIGNFDEEISYVRVISTNGMTYHFSKIKDEDKTKLDLSLKRLIQDQVKDKYIEVNDELYYIRMEKVTDEKEMRSSGMLVIISKIEIEPSISFTDLGDNELKHHYDIEDGLLLSRIYLNEDIAFKFESSLESIKKISHRMVTKLMTLTIMLATFIIGLFLYMVLKAHKAMKLSLSYLEMIIYDQEINVVDDMNNEEVHCFINSIKKISEKIQEKIHQIKKQNSETLSLLVKAIEAKDAYTCGHSERVMLLSSAIAKDIENVNHEALKQAALLHDIGKIAIADTILKKDCQLTDEEYSHIQTHPKRGSDILSVSDSLGLVSRIIIEHHERYDGKGYPNGSAGENICIEARIIALADALDAMISDRPYRQGMTYERALEIILDEKGKQFDPQIVNSFYEKQGVLKEIIKKFKVGVIC